MTDVVDKIDQMQVLTRFSRLFSSDETKLDCHGLVYCIERTGQLSYPKCSYLGQTVLRGGVFD